ncbi:KdsC family phosphatase [Sphingopyxis sp.]|uniref:KdsC family phosphatase n=1 Tax=Sphingopyxis sp. TaxID=1908224 RepID=UPI003D097CEC
MAATDLSRLDALRRVELVIFDFDGVFTDNSVLVSSEGIESVRCWRSDGLGLARLGELGVATLIVSTEKNPVVSKRAEKLKIECRQAIDDKAECVTILCAERGIPLDRVAFVGNDINDIPALKIVGLSVVVADAYPEAAEHADLQLSRNGGYGAVRELCDMVWAARTTAQEKV